MITIAIVVGFLCGAFGGFAVGCDWGRDHANKYPEIWCRKCGEEKDLLH